MLYVIDAISPLKRSLNFPVSERQVKLCDHSLQHMPNMTPFLGDKHVSYVLNNYGKLLSENISMGQCAGNEYGRVVTDDDDVSGLDAADVRSSESARRCL